MRALTSGRIIRERTCAAMMCADSAGQATTTTTELGRSAI